ncbi:MAG: tRNA (N6-threonylcarbamoyladenosine(37)-N6)-methyltransferase TrmO [Cyanobacteria bacterium P01_D01_bin.156]
MTVETVTFTPIAHIQSCYPERFGIPRQAGLVNSAYADIVFRATENNKLALRGIEEFSHLWVLFVFHNQQKFNQPNREFRPLVRPPRLGGNKSVGVYATRSPNRFNPVGMSAVQLVNLQENTTKKEIRLRVQGGDFLDGTPVIDIKPYVPYSDALSHAQGAWATGQDDLLPVQWSPKAVAVLVKDRNCDRIRQLIAETLAQDPRPGYERGKDGRPGQRWNMQIDRYSVFWTVCQGIAEVTELTVISRPTLE